MFQFSDLTDFFSFLEMTALIFGKIWNRTTPDIHIHIKIITNSGCSTKLAKFQDKLYFFKTLQDVFSFFKNFMNFTTSKTPALCVSASMKIK